MSQGYATQLAIDAAGTAIASFTNRFEFEQINLVEETQLIQDEGIRGSRSQSKERVVQGLKTCKGPITLSPSPSELDLLLPWILGAAESSDTFALAETVPPRAVLVDYDVIRGLFDNVYVNRATFRSSPGQTLKLELDLMGKTKTTSATAFPSISIDTDDVYVHHQNVTTLESSARENSTIEITIDNLLSEVFNNSQTPTDIDAQDRIITVSTDVPFKSANTDLFTTPSGSAAGAAGSVVFTNGGKSLTFTFPNLKAIARSPVIAGKSENRLPLNYQAYKSGSTDELVATHDSTA